MGKKPAKLAEATPPRYYRGADIPMRVIRRFAREIAEKFQPDKIILFGSYAYGTPHADSDVDILVIMPAWNELSKACRIRQTLDAPFPMDLIVRTPKHLHWRLAEKESFHTEITTKGKILYEKINPRMDTQGRRRSRRGAVGCRKWIAIHDVICFRRPETEETEVKLAHDQTCR